MKKILAIFTLTALCLLSGCIAGCKTSEKKNEVNPYPLTNELHHADGTKVMPPTW